ncbi:MAG: D-alanyl-D-alanine carboxypeptidase/D-alanyl-D-alanine-endopeptidase [Thiothrix sp.]|nr:D-alanyl-D-alanine carboxypeptidase/D-alanyl-D-alanine-endopeptidase [Thiothrix sp.]HPQ97014.1 D-alanyl-D-alanine carboxypeptidase/D-alanyl-D-alanine-endopeptidase [Thiolinea sp.]
MIKKYCAIGVVFLGISSAWAENGAAVPKPAESVIVRAQETQELPESIRDYLKKKKVGDSDVGIFVQDVNADRPLLAYNAGLPLNPASTMKLLSTWSALKVLGPSWVWDTEAWTRGSIRDGRLDGDLVLRGYGDPFLVDETLWLFVHELRARGLEEISGDIIIDNSFFEVPPASPGAFDGHPDKVYNAIPSALMFNFQATRFLFRADEPRQAVRVEAFPDPGPGKLVNQMKLVSGNCSRSHYNPSVSRGTDGVVVVRGNYTADCGQQSFMRLLTPPAEHAFNAFRDDWQALGGRFSGRMRTGTVGDGDQLFYKVSSRTLLEQIRLINKWSNNVMVRALLLSLGAREFGAPGTPDKGRLAVLQALQSAGIDTTGLVVDNGSGLSRAARITPAQLGTLLLAVWHEPYMPEFLSSLPLLGEDGTLVRRFRRSDLRSRARFKTGTLNKVTALAGYMLTRSGKRMVVVILHNGDSVNRAGRPLQDMLLEWVFEQ